MFLISSIYFLRFCEFILSLYGKIAQLKIYKQFWRSIVSTEFPALSCFRIYSLTNNIHSLITFCGGLLISSSEKIFHIYFEGFFLYHISNHCKMCSDDLCHFMSSLVALMPVVSTYVLFDLIARYDNNHIISLVLAILMLVSVKNHTQSLLCYHLAFGSLFVYFGSVSSCKNMDYV